MSFRLRSMTVDFKMGDTINDILGIVVLYNCTIEGSITLSSLNDGLVKSGDLLDVIVYDNSERSKIISGSTFIKGQLNIHYIHDTTNPGISKAYNIAAKDGKDLKKKWLLLLDQDTTFPLDSFEKYKLGIKENPEIMLFAPVLRLTSGKPISPCRYFLKRGFALKKVTAGINSLNGISLLNSGMLINLDAFSLVGGYNENVKLDFCDFLFIERFKKVYSSCYIIDVSCVHDFSDDERDAGKLIKRFGMYCRDAKNCPRKSIFDWVQYMAVVFGRASKLVIRTRRLMFYKTLWENFLR